MNKEAWFFSQHRSMPESGFVTIRDGFFFDKKGDAWRWDGASQFLLLARMMRGEDVSAQFRWMIHHSVKVARVFVAGVDWSDWEDFRRPFDRPDYELWLARLFGLAASYGIRIEATVVTYDLDIPTWRRALQKVYNAAANRWNIFVEVANEPWVRPEMDPILIADGINRFGILSSYGYQWEYETGEIAADHVLDYGTLHSQRDLQHFPRNSKELLELRDKTGKPWVSDEPLGIAEYDRQGAGARTTDRIAVASHFGIACLFGNGATIHSQFGLEGRAPNPEEIISESLSNTISSIWKFIPPYAQLGTYSAPHIGNFPIECVSGTCSTLSHAYATLGGSVAYLVVPMPIPDLKIILNHPWRFLKQLDDLPIWKISL